MLQIRRELSQRLQYKTTVGESWMRDFKLGHPDDEASEQQDIDVDDSRSLRAQAAAPHFFFDAQEFVQQLTGKEAGFRLRHHVQEPRLALELLGLGFPQR